MPETSIPPLKFLSLKSYLGCLTWKLRSEALDTGLKGQLWDTRLLLPLPWCLLMPPMSIAALYLTLTRKQALGFWFYNYHLI